MKVGEICKEYRIKYITDNLKEFARMIGINYKTLWSFENGQSTNYTILYKYQSQLPLYKTVEMNIRILEAIKNDQC